MLFLSALLEATIEENCIYTVNKLLTVLGIKINREIVKSKLEEHPDFPATLCITDTLSDLGIVNACVKLSSEELWKLEMPIMVQISRSRRTYFSVIKRINTDTVELTDISGKWQIVSWTQFEKEWTGLALIAEVDDETQNRFSGRRLTKSDIHKIAFGGSLTLLICLVVTSTAGMFQLYGSNAIWYALLLLLKLLGCYICSLLLWFDIDAENNSLKKVCGISKSVNCNAVLRSKGANVLGVFNWSEAGAIYFWGGLLTMIFFHGTPFVFSSLGFLNLLALPYILYSLIYQWKIVHQWCLLCLMVQGILLIEGILNAYAGVYGLLDLSNGSHWTVLILPFLLPALLWFMLKPSLLLAKQGRKIKIELTRLKYNTEVFSSVLAKQKHVTVDPTGLGIILGNPNGKTKVIKVCNPYCGPCAEAHPIIDELLEANGDLQVQIIFTATNSDTDKKAYPVKHFLAIAEHMDNQLLKKALDDWYNAETKDYKIFAGKYPNMNLAGQGKKLDDMAKWCQEMKISFTPSFFIQGRQFPSVYKPEDLKYFLSEPKLVS